MSKGGSNVISREKVKGQHSKTTQIGCEFVTLCMSDPYLCSLEYTKHNALNMSRDEKIRITFFSKSSNDASVVGPTYHGGANAQSHEATHTLLPQKAAGLRCSNLALPKPVRSSRYWLLTLAIGRSYSPL